MIVGIELIKYFKIKRFRLVMDCLGIIQITGTVIAIFKTVPCVS